MTKTADKSEATNLRNQIDELNNQFKRALADYQNLEKRYHQDKQAVVKFANESLLDKLLPVIDDLNRAQTHLNDPGLKQIIAQLYRVLESEGVKPIDSTGHPFDPQTMDCTEVVSGPQDLVIDTSLPGYLFHDKVLRPAQVKVGSGSLEASNNNTN